MASEKITFSAVAVKIGALFYSGLYVTTQHFFKQMEEDLPYLGKDTHFKSLHINDFLIGFVTV